MMRVMGGPVPLDQFFLKSNFFEVTTDKIYTGKEKLATFIFFSNGYVLILYINTTHSFFLSYLTILLYYPFYSLIHFPQPL